MSHLLHNHNTNQSTGVKQFSPELTIYDHNSAFRVNIFDNLISVLDRHPIAMLARIRPNAT